MTLLLVASRRLEARALRSASSTATVTRSPAEASGSTGSSRPTAVAVAGIARTRDPGVATGTLTVDPLPSAPLVAGALRRRGLAVRTSGAVVPSAKSSDVSAVMARSGLDTPLAVVSAAGGYRGIKALTAAVPALEEWAGAVGERTALLAGPRAFCAGVERAIDTVERTIQLCGAPVYVRRQIVHNRHVVEALEAKGAVFVRELDEVPSGATVVFSAHGVAPSVRREAVERGLNVVDATCPLVAKVHREVHRFHERGYQVVMIGHSGHDETEGTLGQAPGISLVEDTDAVSSLRVDDPERLAYVTQTTLSPSDVAGILNTLSALYPGVIGPSAADICYATQNRQEAVRAIARECDLVLVVGSENSSNAHRLVEVAASSGCRARLVEDEFGIDLSALKGVSTVGITAAASTPTAVVDRVIAALAALGPLTVEEREVRQERVSFPLPPEVR